MKRVIKKSVLLIQIEILPSLYSIRTFKRILIPSYYIYIFKLLNIKGYLSSENFCLISEITEILMKGIRYIPIKNSVKIFENNQVCKWNQTLLKAYKK